MTIKTPAGDTIEIAINRIAADPSVPYRGALFVNPGRPGQTGKGFSLSLAASGTTDALAPGFDVVGFDPRRRRQRRARLRAGADDTPGERAWPRTDHGRAVAARSLRRPRRGRHPDHDVHRRDHRAIEHRRGRRRSTSSSPSRTRFSHREPTACSSARLARRARPVPLPSPATRSPLLVIGGTLDLLTPLLKAEEMTAAIGNTTLLVSNHYGHGAIDAGAACVAEAVRNYFDRGELPPGGHDFARLERLAERPRRVQRCVGCASRRAIGATATPAIVQIFHVAKQALEVSPARLLRSPHERKRPG